MAKPRLPDIDWVAEGWRTWAILEDVPQAGLLGAPLEQETVKDLEAVQDRLRGFLNYTLYRRKPKWLRLKRGHRFEIRGRTANAASLDQFKRDFGYEFAPNELFASFAHDMLGEVLEKRSATAEVRQSLPLLIASVGGRGIYLAAHKAASATRPSVDRRSNLRRELERCIRSHPGETALQILDRLVADKVVEKSDGERVWYWQGPEDDLKEIGMDRYENVFSQAKKAVETAARTGKRRRRSTG